MWRPTRAPSRTTSADRTRECPRALAAESRAWPAVASSAFPTTLVAPSDLVVGQGRLRNAAAPVVFACTRIAPTRATRTPLPTPDPQLSITVKVLATPPAGVTVTVKKPPVSLAESVNVALPLSRSSARPCGPSCRNAAHRRDTLERPCLQTASRLRELAKVPAACRRRCPGHRPHHAALHTLDGVTRYREFTDCLWRSRLVGGEVPFQLGQSGLRHRGTTGVRSG